MKENLLEKKLQWYKMTFRIIASIVILSLVLLSVGYLINKNNDNAYKEGYYDGVQNNSIDFVNYVNFMLKEQGYIYWTLPNNQTIALVPYVGGGK